jgi:hypothetical protein
MREQEIFSEYWTANGSMPMDQPDNMSLIDFFGERFPHELPPKRLRDRKQEKAGDRKKEIGVYMEGP